MTVAGIVSQAPERAGVSRMAADPPRENPVAFWSLMFFMFVLFMAPQNIFPSLVPLRLAQVAAGLTIVAYVLNRLCNREQPLTIDTPEVRLVSWVTLLAVISIPLSDSPSYSVRFFLGTSNPSFGKSVVVFYLLANLLVTTGRLKWMVGSIVGYGFVIGATAVYNFLTGYTMVSRSEPERAWGYPNPVAFNAVDLALTLNVILALMLGLYWATRRRPVKVLLLTGMGLAVAGIVVSFSRGGFLTLALILTVLLARWYRTQGAVVLLTACVAVVVGVLLAPDGYTERLYSLLDWDRDRVGSIQSRWSQIPAASMLILENPFTGVGLGIDMVTRTTHNIFLQVGVDLGVPGLLIYIMLFVHILRGLRQTQRRLGSVPQAREFVAIASGLELAVWAFLVAGFFLPVTYSFTPYYLAGLAAATRVIGARLTASPALTR